MNLNKKYLFIAVSSVALLIVLIIQVNWILQTAKIKEEIFNEKADMVLSRTTEAISSDKETCRKIGACVEKDSTSHSAAKLGTNEVHKIDSLFNHYMKFYNFHIDYSFEVMKPNPVTAMSAGDYANYIYDKSLDDLTGNSGFELKLIFPEKKQYVIAEMGTLFITSVVLI